MANDTEYGLACAVFTENASKAIRVSNALEAGMAFVSTTCVDVFLASFLRFSPILGQL